MKQDPHRYDDMLDMPHHQSRVHPHMSASNRAAQFSPFAALTGYEAVVSDISDDQFHAVLAENLIVKYENNRFEIEFINKRNNKVSCGRTRRYVKTDHVTDVRILTDESSVEVFVNDGEYVFSTRFYPEIPGIRIDADGAQIKIYEISA